MQALYVKVFEKMQELVPQFSPSSTMADFEEASVSAFRRVFRDVTVTGWFYFVQSTPLSNAYINWVSRTSSHSRQVHHTVACLKNNNKNLHCNVVSVNTFSIFLSCNFKSYIFMSCYFMHCVFILFYYEIVHRVHTKQKKHIKTEKSKSIKADMPANASKSINC